MMPEPLDPIAAGVASALKSLRTRAGMSETRLAKSALAFDALAGLQSVRELAAAGNTVEQAIAEAVRAAVRTLEPTESIVADVILGLGLHPESGPESGLYARDLGRRRTALLENWKRLHQFRSAPWDGPPPTLRALRFEIETRALSALAVALTTTESDARTLGGPIQDVVAPRRISVPRSQVPLLGTEFRRIASALRATLVSHPHGMGWPHDLRKGQPIPHASSYGVRAMLLLEGALSADLVPVAEFLRREAAPGGGYASDTQVAPRPEATADVLVALHMLDGTSRFDAQLATIKRDLGDFERTRPWVLTTILEASAHLGHDPSLTKTLVGYLLAARMSFGGVHLWGQKAERDLVAPVPSTAHTARAVRALVLGVAAMPPNQIDGTVKIEADEAIEQAASWLAAGQDLRGTSEFVDREIASGIERVYVRHFTAAWVVKALVSVGLPVTHPAVSTAVARVWDDYNHETALWRWDNGDLPVWMTQQAVEALQLAAYAVPVPGFRRGEP
jgi:hypothetical protein